MDEQKRRLFKLERTVHFPFDSYCWEDGARVLTCHITISTEQLDAEGFVFDNRKIEEYFASNFDGKTRKISCERIAEEILDFFCNALPNCQGVEIKVTGNPDATWLSASFEQTEDKARAIGA